MALSRQQVDSYWSNGFLAVEDLVPPERVRAMRDRVEWLCANWQSEQARAVGAQQEVESGNTAAAVVERTALTVRKFDRLVLHEDLFRAHALSAEVADAVADLIGSPIALYTDQALLKPPRVGSAKPPHQDGAYFVTTPFDALITCWCALDDATAENGCLHYIPGSHRLGLQDHTVIENTPHKVPPQFRAEAAVPAPVRAGGCLFHHGLTLHMTPPNRTDRWRRAYVCHYVRADATVENMPAGHVITPIER